MPINVIEAIKKIDWKTFVKGPVFIIIVALLAFFWGRYSTPEKTKVVTVDKVVETHHEQTQVVQQIDIDKLLQKVQNKVQYVNRDVVRVVTIKPDGTKVETVTDHSNINTNQNTTTKVDAKTSEAIAVKKALDDYKAEEHNKTTI